MEKLAEQLLTGQWELPLGDSTFTRRGEGPEKQYRGPGLITQRPDKSLDLKMFAQGTDVVEELFDDQNIDLVPGEMVPEDYYYDWVASDLKAQSWSASSLSVSKSFGAGAFFRASPTAITRTEALARPTEKPHIAAWLDTELELPWHKTSDGPNSSTLENRFEHQGELAHWCVEKRETGIWLTFNAYAGQQEPAFDNFLRALSFLTGKQLRPRLHRTIEGSTSRTVVRNVSEVHGNAIPYRPLNLDRHGHEDAHSFIELYINKASAEIDEGIHGGCRSAFRYWLRILGSRETDMESEALILTVAIEGLLKKVIFPLCRPDPEFTAQALVAKRTLSTLRKLDPSSSDTAALTALGIEAIGDRAWRCMSSALGNADLPRVKTALQLLVRHRILSDDHSKAWGGLRHTAAHGDQLEDRLDHQKQHLRYMLNCLDLYYRLVFLWIGYRGNHRNLSGFGMPFQPFDGDINSILADKRA